MRVKPATPGLRVPMPERGNALLPPEGADVPASSYWTRRVQEGSVLVPEDVSHAQQHAHAPAPPRARRTANPEG